MIHFYSWNLKILALLNTYYKIYINKITKIIFGYKIVIEIDEDYTSNNINVLFNDNNHYYFIISNNSTNNNHIKMSILKWINDSSENFKFLNMGKSISNPYYIIMDISLKIQ